MEESMHSPASRSIRFLFRRKWAIMLIVLVFGGGAAGYFAIHPSSYEASSRLLVKFGREYVYRQESDDKSIVQPNFGQDQIVNSLIEIMKSLKIVESVVSQIGITILYPHLDLDKALSRDVSPQTLAVNQFSEDLSIKQSQHSNVIVITYSNEDPTIAADALNMFIEEFRVKHLQLYGETRLEFLRDQLDRLAQDLNQAEENLETFERNNNAYALDQQRELLLRQRSDLETQQNGAMTEAAALGQRLQVLQAQIINVPPTMPISSVTENTPVFVKAEADLLALRMEEQRLATQYGDRHPEVIRVRQAIALAQKSLAAMTSKMTGAETRGANPLYKELTSNIVMTEAGLKEAVERSVMLSTQIQQITERTEALTANDRTLRQLRRDQSDAEQVYQNYLKIVEEARVAGDMDRNKITSISVIDPAVPPEFEEGPSKEVKIALSILFSIIGGVSIAGIIEVLSHRFAIAEDVESTFGLAVLADIPMEKS